MQDIGHFIGGQRIGGSSGRFGPVFNPALGEQTARVALAGAAEVDAAVHAATAAQPDWAATPLATMVGARYRGRCSSSTGSSA